MSFHNEADMDKQKTSDPFDIVMMGFYLGIGMFIVLPVIVASIVFFFIFVLGGIVGGIV